MKWFGFSKQFEGEAIGSFDAKYDFLMKHYMG